VAGGLEGNPHDERKRQKQWLQPAGRHCLRGVGMGGVHGNLVASCETPDYPQIAAMRSEAE
jgi:hypothetical protein